MLNFYQEIRRNRHALTTLTLVNIKTTVATTRLGWLWWIIDPLVMMAIYYFVVKVIFNRGGENYHLFVLCGIISWQFFTRAVTGTSNVILRNRQLLRQIALPISMLITIPVIVQMFFAGIGVVVILIWNHTQIGIQSFGVIPLLLLIALLSMSLGLFLSVITVYFQDTKKFISYFLRAGFFLSPILYPATRVLDSDSVPEFAKIIFKLNPMAWIIPALREILLDGSIFSWQKYFLLLGLLLILTQIGLFWVRAHSSRIVKML